MAVTTWKFFTTTEATWQEWLAACSRAETSIELEQYVFGYGGAIEEKFIDLFFEKRQAGVTVRLLLDVLGSFQFYRSPGYKKLLEAGVEINYHFAILPPPLKRLLPFVLRDHRKLLIIDGKEAHIGGVILQERARRWRDTFVRLEGNIVKELRTAFEKAWKKTLRNEPVGQVVSENEKQEFFMAGNSFHLHDKDLYREFLRAITGAKQYILLTTPYFFPSKEFLRALYFARRKEVEVNILLPKLSDNKIADFLSKLYYRSLKRHGIHVFLYTKEVLHAKTMVVDGHWATIGSCNFDLLSLRWNYELNVISTNARFAQELEDHFLEDLKTAEKIF